MGSSQAPVKASATAQLGCSHLSLRCQVGQQHAHLLGQQGFLPHRQLGHNLLRDAPSQPVCPDPREIPAAMRF